MKKENLKVIIISISSDIGMALCNSWIPKGWEIFGTYRTNSPILDKLKDKGVRIVSCDLSCVEEIKKACSKLKSICPEWDVLILCAGTQEPIGPFLDNNFKDWKESVNINLISQLNVVHELLPNRNKKQELGPCVLFFAGGGTNNATVNYSAYTLSKIALIKMCELLDAEIVDTRFKILGPGWVKTKIHKQTLKASENAGQNYKKTKDKLYSSECTPMDDVVECCEWIIKSPRNIVGGRNLSVVFDMWGSGKLSKKLQADSNMYKLRRYGNDFLIRKKGEK